jgi:hypothetical protein
MLWSGNECGKTKVLRISRKQFPSQITRDKKQLEYPKYFKHVCNMITNDARCSSEIKFRISMAKAAFNKKKTFITSKLELYLRKKLVKCYIWNI